MARSTAVTLARLGRRPARVGGRKARSPQAVLTLADLVAAAFDVVGPDVERVTRVLSSAQMRRAIGRRIVVQ